MTPARASTSSCFGGARNPPQTSDETRISIPAPLTMAATSTANPVRLDDSKGRYGSRQAYAPVGGCDDNDEAISNLELGGVEGENADAAVHKALRLGFIRKVYGILTVQLALTAAVASALTLVDSARDFVLGTPSLLWVGMFASVGVLVALMLYKDRHPLNAQLLLAWTVIEAYTIGVVCAAYTAAGQGYVVIEALVLTLAVFGCLTLFTMQSKIDFSFLGAGLSSALWILILWGFFAYLFGQPAGGVYSLFGALIFSGYIIFDTYLIAQKLGYDDYILASVTLYLDIVNLFFFILQLLSSNRD